MTERIPFQTFGPLAFKPEAGHYWMLPDELAGKIGKRTMIVLRAILKALAINGALQTETWAERRDIINLIPEEQRPKSKRSITGCYANLVELGMFAKRERIPGTNTWPIKLIMALRAQFDDDSAPAAADTRCTQPEVPPAGKPDIEMCKLIISYCAGSGWRLIPLDQPGYIDKLRIEGREQIDPPDDAVEFLRNPVSRMAIWEFLQSTHRRE